MYTIYGFLSQIHYRPASSVAALKQSNADNLKTLRLKLNSDVIVMGCKDMK